MTDYKLSFKSKKKIQLEIKENWLFPYSQNFHFTWFINLPNPHFVGT